MVDWLVSFSLENVPSSALWDGLVECWISHCDTEEETLTVQLIASRRLGTVESMDIVTKMIGMDIHPLSDC